MQHDIPIDEVGPRGHDMAEAIQRCVHCGFCLPTCPTYQVLGEEMDSPRGRIFLMKEVLEAKVPLEDAMPYVDQCLGCVGCQTSCPSGVGYGELLTSFRAMAEKQRKRTWSDRALRSMVLSTLPYPDRFRRAARLGMRFRRFSKWLPRRMRGMLDLLPDSLPPRMELPSVHPAEGPQRARVALLAGCAQQVLWPDINLATLRVLARNGVETFVPSEQVCCGALSAHTGSLDQAIELARVNLRAFPNDVDAVISNAAGCGSGVKEYPLWFRGQPEEPQARSLASRTRDICEFLDQLGIVQPPALPRPLKVAYHDACHLAHAQGIRAEPRRLLRSIEGLELVEIAEGDICCGSAGIYNIEHPRTADQLGQEKARHALETGADVVVAGNIGCMMQLLSHLQRRSGQSPIVLHTIELLDWVYSGELDELWR